MTGIETAILIGTAASVAGTVASTIATRNQMQFQASVSEEWAAYNAQVQAANAEFALAIGDHNAEAARERAKAEAARLKRDRSRQIGSATARFAASGGQLTGTPLLVLSDLEAEAEEERQLVLFGGEIAASEELLNAQLIARREMLGVSQSEFQGSVRSRTARAQAAKALAVGFFTGASQLASGYYDYKQAGGGGGNDSGDPLLIG